MHPLSCLHIVFSEMKKGPCTLPAWKPEWLLLVTGTQDEQAALHDGLPVPERTPALQPGGEGTGLQLLPSL